MKFLIDAQLPPRLVGWLTTRGFETTHVAELPNCRTACVTLERERIVVLHRA